MLERIKDEIEMCTGQGDKEQVLFLEEIQRELRRLNETAHIIRPDGESQGLIFGPKSMIVTDVHALDIDVVNGQLSGVLIHKSDKDIGFDIVENPTDDRLIFQLLFDNRRSIDSLIGALQRARATLPVIDLHLGIYNNTTKQPLQ